MEIERKFLIGDIELDLTQFKSKHISQVYVCSNPTIRARKLDNKYVLTIKSKLGIEGKSANAGAQVCEEFETPLTKEAYDHLVEKKDGEIVEKTRYYIPESYFSGKESKLLVEYDVFEGRLAGLRVAEIEFETEEDAKKYSLPNGFIKDVSLDKRYSNRSMSMCDEKTIEDMINNK